LASGEKDDGLIRWGVEKRANISRMRRMSCSIYRSRSARRRGSRWNWRMVLKTVCFPSQLSSNPHCFLEHRKLTPSARLQLHHPPNNRPLLPPPRILHPQRRAPLLPHPLPPTSTHPPPTRQQASPRRIPPRIRPPNLRPRRHPPALAPPHLNPPQPPPPLHPKTPPAPPRLRRHRLRRRVLHLPPLPHHGSRSPHKETRHWRSAPASTIS
jgi:hypothetical protein